MKDWRSTLDSGFKTLVILAGAALLFVGCSAEKGTPTDTGLMKAKVELKSEECRGGGTYSVSSGKTKGDTTCVEP